MIKKNLFRSKKCYLLKTRSNPGFKNSAAAESLSRLVRTQTPAAHRKTMLSGKTSSTQSRQHNLEITVSLCGETYCHHELIVRRNLLYVTLWWLEKEIETYCDHDLSTGSRQEKKNRVCSHRDSFELFSFSFCFKQGGWLFMQVPAQRRGLH